MNEVPSRPNDPLSVEPSAAQLRTSRIKMLLMFAIISAPVIFSYGAYYLHKPVGRSNYGALIEPQSLKGMAVLGRSEVQEKGRLAVSAPAAGDSKAPVKTDNKTDGQADTKADTTAAPQTLGDIAPLQRRWLMVTLGSAACDAACARRLLYVRQLRWATGVDMERIERVWILTDDQTPPAALLAEHQGLHLLRVDKKTIEAHFKSQDNAAVSDHVWLVDPLGNLMMRFPRDADPDKMKRDLQKLLRSSRIG